MQVYESEEGTKEAGDDVGPLEGSRIRMGSCDTRIAGRVGMSALEGFVANLDHNRSAANTKYLWRVK
jgi:hypothetical protein